MVAACGVSAQVTAKHDGLHYLWLLASQEGYSIDTPFVRITLENLKFYQAPNSLSYHPLFVFCII